MDFDYATGNADINDIHVPASENCDIVHDKSVCDISCDNSDIASIARLEQQVDEIQCQVPAYLSEPVTLEHDVIHDITSGFDRYINYSPVVLDPSIGVCKTKGFNHKANKLGSQLNIAGWLHELSYENDANLYKYIHFGVTEGFLIVDDDAKIPSYEFPNYASVVTGKAHDFVDSLILQELREGYTV